MVDANVGQFGGKVVRTLVTGGKRFPPGTELPADLVMSWSLRNRAALERSGKIEFYSRPAPTAAEDKQPPKEAPGSNARAGFPGGNRNKNR